MLRRLLAVTVLLACGFGHDSSARAGQESSNSEARSSHEPGPLDGLDRYIEAGLARWQIPGLAIAVVKDDRVVYCRGFGVREAGKPGKVTGRTMFAMASQSKAFTATAIGLLVDSGKLDWNDRAIDHLPWFRMRDPYVTRELTVRDLLCHRCGLGTWQGDLVWYGSDRTSREVLDCVRFLEPVSSFRSQYGYCNLMFVAAGEILAERSGATWDEFLHRGLFAPMGMSRTNTKIQAMEQLDDVARPHTIVDGKIIPIAYRETKNTAPAGGINSCVEDWTRWLRLQINGGTLDGKRIVPEAIIRETRTPQTIVPAQSEADDPPFSAYGLGWALRDYEGHRIVSHGGGLDGMLSLSVIVPVRKIGVVVLTNYDEQEFYGELPFHVIDAYLGVHHDDRQDKLFRARQERERRERQAEERQTEADDAEGNSTVNLSAYAGVYQHPALGRATITAKDGKLFLEIERNPGLCGELKHRRFQTLRIDWSDPYFRTSTIPFRLDENGKADEFRIKVRPDFVDPMEYRFTRTDQ